MMTPLDTVTLTALRPALQSQGLSDDSLLRWWQATAAGTETLADFLVHEGVLAADVKKTLVMVQKGYLNADGLAVISPSCAMILTQRVRSHGIAATPAPVRRTRTPAPTSPVVAIPTRPVVVVPQAGIETVRETPEPARVGGRVGRCLLTRLLGQGGGGVVYEAMHQGLGIMVAVKLLPPGGTAPGVLGSLAAEARALARLQHPNVTRVLDFDADAPTPYLVMELVSGLSLAELIEQSGGLRAEQAVNLVAQAACGLGAGHRAGIVHRDVKPANILVDRTGVAKVADLGLAAPAAGPDGSNRPCGTVAYMAPERFEGRTPADARSDIYSLGVTLYEALTGALPYAGGNGFELMVQHATAPVPDPRRLNPLVSPGLAGLVARMMAKAPADRFATYEPLLEEFARYVGPPPAGRAAASRHSWAMTSDDTGRFAPLQTATG